LFVDVDGTGTLAERVEQLVITTTRVYASVAPVRRAALRVAIESAPVQEQIGRARAWLLREIDRAVGAELADREPHVKAAVEAMCSFETWDQMRTGQGLDQDRTRAVIIGAVLALLA